MSNETRLLFAFASLKKDSMSNAYLTSPQEVITDVRFGEKKTVMVTFGFYAVDNVPLYLYAAVYPEGNADDINKATQGNNRYVDIRSTPVADDKGVFVMSIEVNNVHFDRDGIYEISARIFPGDVKPNETNQIDSVKSFLYVLTRKD